jgi:hypothetical protein
MVKASNTGVVEATILKWGPFFSNISLIFDIMLNLGRLVFLSYDLNQ